MANAEQWDVFVKEWDACLKQKPGIRWFKMYDAAHKNGEFRGFTHAERDQKLRTLCRTLGSAGITEISCIIELSSFMNLVKSRWEDKLFRHPYFFPFHVMITTVCYESLTRGEIQRFEIIFDENKIFGPRAKLWYPIILSTMKPDTLALMPPEPLFRSDHQVLPLQAADLTAWITQKQGTTGLGEFGWILDELRGLVRSPLSRLLRAELPKILQDVDNTKNTSEGIKIQQAALRAYRDIFGKDWI